ncbi:DUF6286 domain-containing protein [Nocardioides zeae]|uniref:DUF6286 domain-containing protein n=1 Tax=Nocardioides imazamoxiresistens TaxID=3231893 RepID=A0ABU3PW87_9ACTN|nr:DUF6286 domain-containing protein [Nocardioides zeae]MDT9593501.1 DUF6286 domain-containing protein [Nocardioides zeae]
MSATTPTSPRDTPRAPLPRPLRAAPRAFPPAAGVALLLALLAIGAAVVGVHDLAADRGWSQDSPWVPPVVDALDGLGPEPWLVGVGVLLGILGVWMIVVALAPARSSHLRANGTEADLWLAPEAVAALAQTVADRTSGVIAAETTRVSRRRVRVAVTTNRDAAAVRGAVETGVAETVGRLTRTRVQISTKELPR